MFISNSFISNWKIKQLTKLSFLRNKSQQPESQKGKKYIEKLINVLFVFQRVLNLNEDNVEKKNVSLNTQLADFTQKFLTSARFVFMRISKQLQYVFFERNIQFYYVVSPFSITLSSTYKTQQKTQHNNLQQLLKTFFCQTLYMKYVTENSFCNIERFVFKSSNDKKKKRK